MAWLFVNTYHNKITRSVLLIKSSVNQVDSKMKSGFTVNFEQCA